MWLEISSAIGSPSVWFFDATFFDWRPRRVTPDFRCLIAEPRRWSAADVAAWVQWARRQLQLPSVPMESFNVDGATLASLTEEEFCQRAPQVSANIETFWLTLIRFTLVEIRAHGRSENYINGYKVVFFLRLLFFLCTIKALLNGIFPCNFLIFDIKYFIFINIKYV